MAHLTKRTFFAILSFTLPAAVLSGLVVYLLLCFIASFSFGAFLALFIPVILVFAIGYFFLVVAFCCRGVRTWGGSEGVFHIQGADEPEFWNRKMGYLRVVEILIPKELRAKAYRRCGASIGDEVIIAGRLTDPDLVEIGDGAFIGEDARVLGHLVEGDTLYLKKVKIGKNCTLGTRSLIMPGAEIGEGATVGACTLVPKNKKIPAGTVWAGVPAREVKGRP